MATIEVRFKLKAPAVVLSRPGEIRMMFVETFFARFHAEVEQHVGADGEEMARARSLLDQAKQYIINALVSRPQNREERPEQTATPETCEAADLKPLSPFSIGSRDLFAHLLDSEHSGTPDEDKPSQRLALEACAVAMNTVECPSQHSIGEYRWHQLARLAIQKAHEESQAVGGGGSIPSAPAPVNTNEPAIVKGAAGDYFVQIGAGLWRIESDGKIGADEQSRADFVGLLAKLVQANQSTPAGES